MDARTEFQQKISHLRGLEGDFKWYLSNGYKEESVKVLKQVIEGYINLGAIQTAKNLNAQYGYLLKEFNIEIEVAKDKAHLMADSEQVLKFITALEKKVKRRLLQGKTDEAVEDLKYIISKLRELNHHEKADLLETTLHQFVMEISGEGKFEVPTKAEPPKIKPITLPGPVKRPFAPPPTSIPSVPFPTPQQTPPPSPASYQPSPTVPVPPPPPQISSSPPPPPSQVTGTVSTIKDLPLSDEELVLKKLFDIKDMLSKKP